MTDVAGGAQAVMATTKNNMSETEPPTSTPLSTQETPSLETYRFPWGKHKGKPLAEIPLTYISWLQSSCEAYKGNSSMQRIVEQHLAIANTTSSSQSSQLPTSTPSSSLPQSSLPSSSAPPRTPLASLDPNAANGPYILTFGKYKDWKLLDVPADYIAWLKKSETIKNNPRLIQAVAEYDSIPRVYKLCFGKWKGSTLDEVPPTYLNYLHESDAAKENEDLRKALAEHKAANASSQRSGTTNRRRPFICPDEYTIDYRRYYYNGDRQGGQMWIGCNDALRYFGADARAMVGEGLKSFHRGQRFWLHQVFAYAKHFNTTKGETPTKALNKFKAKNYNK